MKQSSQSSVREFCQEQDSREKSRAELKSPRDWALELGHLKLRPLPSETRGALTECYSAPHASAIILHGWRQHQHHAGSPLLLTRADYELALAATQIAHEVTPDEPNAYRPHKAALSPHKSKRL